MPPSVRQSSLFGKYKDRAKAIFDAEKEKPFVPSRFADLPPGINNGIARVERVQLMRIKEGKQNAGELMFFARAINVLPTEFKGLPIEGLSTSITEPLFDTPSKSRKTFDEHWSYVVNILKMLDPNVADQDFDEIDEINAYLEEIGNQQPYIRYRTYEMPRQDIVEKDGYFFVGNLRYRTEEEAKVAHPFAGREPQTFHEWQGPVPEGWVPPQREKSTSYDSSGDRDDSPPEPRKPTPRQVAPPSSSANEAKPAAPKGGEKPAPKAAPKAAPQPEKPAAKPAVAAPKAKAPPKPAPPPEPEPEGAMSAEELEGLAQMAEEQDEDAVTKLAELAAQAGYTADQIRKAKNWSEVVSMIQSPVGAGQGENQAGDSGETLPFSPEADTGEGGGFPFAVGEVYGYRPLDRQTRKPGKAVVPCEITGVNEENGTVDLRNTRNPRLTYSAVSVDVLESAPE